MEGAQVTLCGFREVLSKYKREREREKKNYRRPVIIIKSKYKYKMEDENWKSLLKFKPTKLQHSKRIKRKHFHVHRQSIPIG